MVSKKAAGSVKSVSKKTAAKKVSLKSASKKVSSQSVGAKAPVKKVLDAQVPVKADVNPIKDVLEIKAHNAEKKAIKKGKVQKASVKEKTSYTTPKSFSSKGGLWAAFVNGYKNILNFSGRTSRYEFWAFMLSNTIVCLIAFLLLGISTVLIKSETAVLSASLLIFIVEVLVFLSITVRRLHDTGVSAWTGYYKPVVMSLVTWVLLVILATIIVSVVDNEVLATTLWQIVSVCYGLLFIATIVALVYYIIKISTVSSYYEGEENDNIYGIAEFNNDYYKEKGLQYTVLCLTFCLLITAIFKHFGPFPG